LIHVNGGSWLVGRCARHLATKQSYTGDVESSLAKGRKAFPSSVRTCRLGSLIEKYVSLRPAKWTTSMDGLMEPRLWNIPWCWHTKLFFSEQCLVSHFHFSKTNPSLKTFFTRLIHISSSSSVSVSNSSGSQFQYLMAFPP
jgi:hypothetical protein